MERIRNSDYFYIAVQIKLLEGLSERMREEEKVNVSAFSLTLGRVTLLLEVRAQHKDARSPGLG